MNTYSHETRHRLLPVAILCLLALVTAGAVWLLTQGTGPSTPDEASIHGEHNSHAGESSGKGRPAAATLPDTVPADGVELPAGRDQVDGHQVRFPHSDLGAVATQVEIAKGQIGFDYDQAVRLAGIYTTRADQPSFEERARAAVAQRRSDAGVAAEGDPAAPASYALSPIAFTVTKVASDRYLVNLLSYVTLTTTQAATNDYLYAGTQMLAWDGTDWKLVEPTPEEYEQIRATPQPQAAAPKTDAFKQAGWIPITGALE